ncbi:MAG: GIY-YIG nuclease family protein [bacterium]
MIGKGKCVYMIHFDRPVGDVSNPHGSAQHYIGYTTDLEARMKEHRAGNGSKLMAAVSAQGIAWRVVVVWPGAGRDWERQLKRRKDTPRWCPICGQQEVPHSEEAILVEKESEDNEQ